jgi:U11/U12 small nuclear ribonucleoprotein SNRNP35
MKEYDCLTVGNPRGNKSFHDKALKRALEAKCKADSDEFRSPSDPPYTLFVGRLSRQTTEADLQDFFSRYGRVMSAVVVKDLFGNVSQGYGFVEFVHRSDAAEALKVSVMQQAQRRTIHGAKILIDWQRSGAQAGWKPRRLGGGLGGRKESGQMRFDN